MNWQYATSAAFTSVTAACCTIVHWCRSTGQRKLFPWTKPYKFAAIMIHSHEIFPLLHILQHSWHCFTQQVNKCQKCSSTIISRTPGFISTKKKWPTNDQQDPNKNPNCLASAWPGVLTLYFNKTWIFTWTLADVYCKKKCHEVNKFSSPVWLFINVTVLLKWIVLSIAYLQDLLFFPKVVFHCH